jgi:hypothetical protein
MTHTGYVDNKKEDVQEIWHVAELKVNKTFLFSYHKLLSNAVAV